MKSHSLVDRIKQMGFSEYEAKCYLALFERGSLTVGEVIKIAKIPKPNAYQAMERLLAKGVSVAVPGKTKRYAASDPSILKEKVLAALSVTVESELEKFEKKQKEISDMKMKEILKLERKRKTALDAQIRGIREKEKTLQENIDVVTSKLNVYYKNNRSNGNPLEYIEILKNSDQISRKLTQFFSEAKHEVVGFTKPPFFYTTEKQRKGQLEAQSDARKRGVITKSIHEMPTDKMEWETFLKEFRDYVVPNKNDENRVIESLPMKMIIFDGCIVVFSLDDQIQNEPSVTSLVVEHHALAKSLKELFESYWKKAKDYYILDGKKYCLPKYENDENTQSCNDHD
jgi:HTH-type transcriptional regulator, sugar sensing transcriptional regulator